MEARYPYIVLAGKHLDKYQAGTQGEFRIIYTNIQKQKGCENGRLVEATDSVSCLADCSGTSSAEPISTATTGLVRCEA